MCSHDPFFRTNKESSIWRQNDHEKICRCLSSRQGECQMKTEHVLFPSVFLKLTDPFDGRSFLMCSHDSFFRNQQKSDP